MKISASGRAELEQHPQAQSILFDQKSVNLDNNNNNKSGSNSRDVELGMELNESKLLKEPSYDYWNASGPNPMALDGGNVRQRGSGSGDGGGFDFQKQQKEEIDNPPSKLLAQFLNKQKASGELSFDFDEEELRKGRGVPPLAENTTSWHVLQRELKVPFGEPVQNHDGIVNEPIQRRYKESFNEEEYRRHHQNYSRGSSNLSYNRGGEKGDVLICTSNASFRRNSSLLKAKTIKSRLMDPPPSEEDKNCGRTEKSAQLKYELLGRLKDGDEEDPFTEEDVPEEFKKANFNALTIFQWVSLISILAALVCSLSISLFSKRTLWDVPLWKWELLVLVLICGRLFSGWGNRLVVFMIERNFLLRKRVLYFVYGVRKAVQNCLWLGLVLIAWHFMFNHKVEREVKNKTLPHITKILMCLLVTAFLWLAKVVLVKVLASSFHVSAYFDRIQESLFHQYVIETLSGPPLIEIKNTKEEEEKVIAEVKKLQNAGANMPADLWDTTFPTKNSEKIISSGGLQWSPWIGKSFRVSGTISKQKDEGITIDHLHKLNQKNISAWNMKRMINIIRHRLLYTLDERMLDSSNEDESATHISTECEAKCAAKKIFFNVARPGSKYIYVEDLMRFMREGEAMKAVSLFEGATESKRVNKSVLKNWLVNAFRERRALALTLDDTKTAVKQLHRVVSVAMCIVIVVLWLLLLEIATTQLLVFISSQLLLVAFMFGNTCKMVFEAIIFLFVMHPFDVGDRCEVDGVQMVVEEMNILTTVFLRYDNQKIIYPNSFLSTKPISNYYRSPDMGDAIDFCVHIATSVEKIALMKQRITGYIENKKDHWYPSPMVVVRDVEDMNRLKLSVWATHRMNHQDMGERWVRRALLVEEMIKIFRELDIEYRLLPHDVNIRNMPSSTSSRLPSNWTACST